MIEKPKFSTEHYTTCCCGCEVVVLSKWPDEEEIYLSIFRHEYLKPTLKSRLSYIWKILTTGKYFSDEVVLTKDRALKISEQIKGFYKIDDNHEQDIHQ
jgi:hypothetical protein